MTLQKLYKQYRENIPWLAEHRKNQLTRKLEELRIEYKLTKDTSKKEDITKQAEELQTYIQALT